MNESVAKVPASLRAMNIAYLADLPETWESVEVLEPLGEPNTIMRHASFA